jgi:GT2 family glycosyltransferase
VNNRVNDAQALYPAHVVILNWNLPWDTIACVESVQASALSDVEIIVVDNGSTDDSLALFQERLGDQVLILTAGENLGFAGGVNLGIERAIEEGAQSVLLLNNDTIVDPDMLRHLALAASQSPKVGVVGPIIYYHDQPEQVWRFADREYPGLPVPMKLPEEAIVQAEGVPFSVDYVTACGMLIRREVFERVGLFDTRYFFYFEDADFCRRARMAGFQIWCAPQAKMWHKVSLSARKAKPGTRYAEYWGRARFYRTYPHGFSRALTLSYLVLKLLLTTAQDVVHTDLALIGPAWTGFLDGQRGQPSEASRFFP